MARKKGGKKGRKRSLFGPARHPKYAKIVKFTTIKDARESARRLLREFKSAKTRDKAVRVKRVTVLAANRAEAAAKRRKLSKRERHQLRRIAEVYRKAADRMKLPPRR